MVKKRQILNEKKCIWCIHVDNPNGKLKMPKHVKCLTNLKKKIMGEREPVKKKEKGGNQTIVQEANKQRKQYFHIWN